MLVSVTTQHRLVRLVFSPSVLQFSLPVSFRSVPPLGPVRLMASLWTQLISMASLLLSLARWVPVSGDSSNVLLLPSPHHEGSRPAMILPLHHSVPDSSFSHFNPRRQLKESDSEHHPNARMRLYDDLLRNGLVSFTPSLPLFFFSKIVFAFFVVVNYVCVFWEIGWSSYYTARLWIGTPPQRFALIVDTGSTVTYVPCSTCRHCGSHQVMLPATTPTRLDQ